MNNPLRCPYCNQRLGDYVDGTYKTKCPRKRCGEQVVIERRKNVDRKALTL